ncbi:type VII secretion protein EsaA [Oceanobacillus sp. CFH 90083]|uniref:type VII secretion protein EsaA n=1 Tax=Oceanobacillus sp. CFH 90083 TaxID=2592336 RepID=UPI00128BC96B|nr:type VII secretion protein EsaA [Oceanobacillus sp. CFH 90083]
MKKIDKRWFLFLVLIIVLASGLSFLTLNQQEETEDPNKAQTMSIALVNEDNGFLFNEAMISFGDAFVNSISFDNQHEWYVVSRGVAENGLSNNTYDMMIVIPNDFSEKSLNIYSEAPEQVVLSYRINASENPRIREEAERTASDVLNRFNRQIIDVYFASIVGNLQNAQDNIAEMVDQQAGQTGRYQNVIHTPLSGYTDQFDQLKNQSERSVEQFDIFEQRLISYENQFGEEAQQGEAFLTEMENASEEVTELRSNYISIYQSFQSYIEQVNQEMRASSSSADDQLMSILAENQTMADLLSEREEKNYNNTLVRMDYFDYLLTNAEELENYFELSAEQMETLRAEIDLLLENNNEAFRLEMTEQIEDALDEMTEDNLYLNQLLSAPNQIALDNIDQAVKQLPSRQLDDFVNSGLPNEKEEEIRQVLRVANQYQNEFDRDIPIAGDNQNLLKDELDRLQKNLKNGFEIEDKVHIPENEKDGQVFTLQIPDSLHLSHLIIQLPGSGEGDYTASINENGEVYLPANEEGELTVRVGVRPGAENSFNFFDPIEWSWKLEQEDVENVDEPEEVAQLHAAPSITAGIRTAQTIPVVNTEDNTESDEEIPGEESEPDENREEEIPDENSESDGNREEETENEEANEDDEETEETEENHDNEEENEGSEDENGSNDREEEEDTDQEGESPGEEEEEQEEEIERLYVKNNTIQHKVMTSIHDLNAEMQTLLNTTIYTVNHYQKVQGLLENYFGADIYTLSAGLGNQSLTSLATDESLYHLFNEQDFNNLMKDYFTAQILDDMANQLEAPVQEFNFNMDAYQNGMEEMKLQAEELVEQALQTNNETTALNTDLSETLTDVQAWREESLQLFDEQPELAASAEGEQIAVMNLSSEFRPLLSYSQSLAEQAGTNLDQSNQVYETFEQLNQQAADIEQSGLDLVGNAETLAEDMVSKLTDDESFVENFSEVLANSRIGDRQNETLYDFLSNPVDASNEGTMLSQGNTFTPYFLVLITFVVVLFTAYVISTIHQKYENKSLIDEDGSLIRSNLPITLIIGGVGILEGIVIGIVASYYLPVSQWNMLQLTLLMIFTVLGMLLVSTYLLRQLKMLGMFIMLVILSFYLFFTNALGTGNIGMPELEKFSPMQYFEAFLIQLTEGNASIGLAFFVFMTCIILGSIGNLFVIHRTQREEDDTDESQMEQG